MTEADLGKNETHRQEVRGVLAAGTRLRGYEVVTVLGQGGFGVTYRARDTTLGRDVAIKEYMPTSLAVREDGTMVLARSTELADEFVWGRERFLEEARTLAKLDRAPAIVRVYDFLEANGTAYIIMELVGGETLERRIRKKGRLSAAEIDKILWPLLEGLEQVHNAGFLHRDIKPANILLDAEGRPTLIDFGASRAAMAAGTTAMTAVFTPGYAAAEQMTSSKQGPWTDIYGVSATLYHAITGTPPPGAFDRLLNDEYAPLTKLLPAGFAPGLLVGFDAGLAVPATDRPQSIAGWRPILSQVGTFDTQATAVFGQPADPGATVVLRPTGTTLPAAPSSGRPEVQPPPKHRPGLWIALATATAIALGGGGYYFATKTAGPDPVAIEELARLREADAKRKAEEEAQQRAEAEAATRRQIEEETRRKIEAELQEKQKAEAEAAAKQKADEDAKKGAEATETGLRLTPADRQHVQVALTTLGFNTNGTDGTFGPRTRDMIGAWQKSRNFAETGYLTGPQSQALFKEAAPAITKYDDEQKKLEEARKKTEEEKAKAEAAADRPLEEKRISLSNYQGTGCDAQVGYTVRIYANKLEVGFKGGWQPFHADAGGDFSRTFQNATTGSNLSVSGSLKTRAISVTNLANKGCAWRGTF